MSKRADASPGGFTPSLLHHVEQVCDQFEAAWKSAASTGQRPRIADYLGDTPEPERSTLLRELVALDIDYRREAGEQPQPEEYRAWLPSLDLSGWVRKNSEDPKKQPHRRSASPLPEDPPLVAKDSRATRSSTLSGSDGTSSAERQFLQPGTV